MAGRKGRADTPEQADETVPADVATDTTGDTVETDQADETTAPAARKGDRVETYSQVGPDGEPVTVRHNIDTGTTEIVS